MYSIWNFCSVCLFLLLSTIVNMCCCLCEGCVHTYLFDFFFSLTACVAVFGGQHSSHASSLCSVRVARQIPDWVVQLPNGRVGLLTREVQRRRRVLGYKLGSACSSGSLAAGYPQRNSHHVGPSSHPSMYCWCHHTTHHCCS